MPSLRNFNRIIKATKKLNQFAAAKTAPKKKRRKRKRETASAPKPLALALAPTKTPVKQRAAPTIGAKEALALTGIRIDDEPGPTRIKVQVGAIIKKRRVERHAVTLSQMRQSAPHAQAFPPLYLSVAPKTLERFRVLGSHCQRAIQDVTNYVNTFGTSQQKHGAILLHGPSGCGKSTLARVALEAAGYKHVSTSTPELNQAKTFDEFLEHLELICSKTDKTVYRSGLKHGLVVDTLEALGDGRQLAALRGALLGKHGRPKAPLIFCCDDPWASNQTKLRAFVKANHILAVRMYPASFQSLSMFAQMCYSKGKKQGSLADFEPSDIMATSRECAEESQGSFLATASSMAQRAVAAIAAGSGDGSRDKGAEPLEACKQAVLAHKRTLGDSEWYSELSARQTLDWVQEHYWKGFQGTPRDATSSLAAAAELLADADLGDPMVRGERSQPDQALLREQTVRQIGTLAKRANRGRRVPPANARLGFPELFGKISSRNKAYSQARAMKTIVSRSIPKSKALRKLEQEERGALEARLTEKATTERRKALEAKLRVCKEAEARDSMSFVPQTAWDSVLDAPLAAAVSHRRVAALKQALGAKPRAKKKLAEYTERLCAGMDEAGVGWMLEAGQEPTVIAPVKTNAVWSHVETLAGKTSDSGTSASGASVSHDAGIVDVRKATAADALGGSSSSSAPPRSSMELGLETARAFRD